MPTEARPIARRHPNISPTFLSAGVYVVTLLHGPDSAPPTTHIPRSAPTHYRHHRCSVTVALAPGHHPKLLFARGSRRRRQING